MDENSTPQSFARHLNQKVLEAEKWLAEATSAADQYREQQEEQWDLREQAKCNAYSNYQPKPCPELGLTMDLNWQLMKAGLEVVSRRVDLIASLLVDMELRDGIPRQVLGTLMLRRLEALRPEEESK